MTLLDRAGLRATAAFLTHELRRHLGTVLLGWAVLVAPPLAYRFVEGDWGFYSGDWRQLATQLVCGLLTPGLAAVMAISGWAREREEGSLEWLYSHPLPSGRLFAVRVAAILLATTVWTAGCLALYRVTPRDVAGWSAPLVRVVSVWLGLLLFGLGTGLLAAALSATRTQAFRRWLVGVSVVGIILPNLLYFVLPIRGMWLALGSTLVLRANEAYVWVLGLGSLALAGWLMRRAPGEIRLLRGLGGLTGATLAALAGGAAILLQPLRVDSGGPAAVRDLGEGVRLELLQAKGLAPGIYHPVIRGPSGSRVLRRAFVRGDRLFTHPASGRAMLRDVAGMRPGWPVWSHSSSNWVVVGRDGWLHRVHLNEGSFQDPLGWSANGRRFVWRTLFGRRNVQGGYSARNLLVLDEDLRLRFLIVPDLPLDDPNPWTAAWIGDDRLLVTTEPVLYAFVKHYRPRPYPRHWWMVITAEGRRLTGPHELPLAGRRLFSPAMSFTPEGLSLPGSTFSPSPVSRVGEVSYFLLAGAGDAVVAAIDPAGWQLRQGPPVAWDPGPFAVAATETRFVASGYVSLGTLADGTLVWTARAAPRETVVFALDAPDGEPRRACLFDHDPTGIGGFRGATGGWAIWSDGQEKSLHACHVASGVTRQLTDLGPLGARSADVTAEGVLGLDGGIELEASP